MQFVNLGYYAFYIGPIFELSNLPKIQSLYFDDDLFEYVKTFIIDELNQLTRVSIGKNSFFKENYGYDSSKSFHIMNCASLKLLEIGEYSFRYFAGEFELKNLPQLQSIQIGTVGSDSYNFYGSSFVIQGIEVILSI